MPQTPSAIDLAAALRDGRATVVAPVSVPYDAGDCVNSGAAWPSFDLTIAFSGWVLRVPAWKCAAWGLTAAWGGSSRGWGTSDDDGQCRGFRQPVVREAEDGRYVVVVRGGDNLGDDVELDAGDDEATAEAASDTIGEVLRSAYDEVDVPEPSLDDLGEGDVPGHAWVSLSYACGIDVGPALHPIVADGADDVDYDDDYDGGREGVVWLVRGLPVLAARRYETRGDAEAAVREELPGGIAECSRLSDVVVAVEDSLAAGNCREETERAAALIRQRRGLGEDDDVTAEDVLAVLAESDGARRACAVAALRQ